MTLPTSELNAFSLPALYSATAACVGREHFVDDLLDCADVGDLSKAALFDDRVGVAFAGPHRVEDFLGDLAGDRAVLDAAMSPASCVRHDAALRRIDFGTVERS